MLEWMVSGFETKGGVATNGEFEGYGSIFGNQDLQRDVVHRGAFTESLRKSGVGEDNWPKMFYEHDQQNPIGEWLDLREDDKGLYAKGKLWVDPPHPDIWALKAYRSMQSSRGSHGLSIGYQVVRADNDAAKRVRNLRELRLREISPVTMPANPSATVTGVKAITSVRQFEGALRDLGFSRREAAAVAREGFEGFLETRRDDGASEDLNKAQALPSPGTTEDHQTFMERCMVHPAMASKYPDHVERSVACRSRAEGKSDDGTAGRDDPGADWTGAMAAIATMRVTLPN